MKESEESLKIGNQELKKETEVIEEVKDSKAINKTEEGGALYSKGEGEARKKFIDFSDNLMKDWNSPEKNLSMIIPLTMAKIFNKQQNIDSHMFHAARDIQYVCENFKNPEKKLSSGDAIDTVIQLFANSECYRNTHRGYQFWDDDKKRKALAIELRDRSAKFIRSFATEEDIKEISAPPELKGCSKFKVSSVEGAMRHARRVIDSYNKFIAENSPGLDTEAVIHDKLEVYKRYDTVIRLYRSIIPKEKWDREAGMIIEEYENLLYTEKLLERKKSFGGKEKTTNTVDATIEKHVEEEDVREHKEPLKKEEVDKGLTNEQIQAVRAIDHWLLRNSQNGGIGGIFANIAKNDNSAFVSNILSKTVRERLFIYYLVEKQARRHPTMFDVGFSQNVYVPDLNAFKDQMLATKLKFYLRFTGKYTYMHKLQDAVFAANNFQDEIWASGMYSDNKKEDDKELTEEEILFRQRVDTYNRMSEKMKVYLKFLRDAEKTKGDVRKANEDEAKKMADMLDVDFKDFRQKDKDFRKKYRGRFYSNKKEAPAIAKNYGKIGKNVDKLSSGMRSTYTMSGKSLDWSWGMDDSQWEEFHLWTGSITSSISAAASGVSAICGALSLAKSYREMTETEFTTKAMQISQGAISTAKSVLGIVKLVSKGGAYTVKEGATFRVAPTEFTESTGAVLGATMTALDVGIAVNKTKGVIKQTIHANNAKEYFKRKQADTNTKELTDEQKKKKKRKEKLERNMVKLSDDVRHRNKVSAGYQCGKAVLGVVSLVLPGIGTIATVVKGVLGIIASIHDCKELKKLHTNMFDGYFNMDELVEKVLDAQKRKSPEKKDRIYTNREQLKETLRRRVAAAAGFCDLRGAADYIATVFSKYIHGALFGPAEERVQGDERRAYIELLKSFDLPFDEKKKIPAQHVIFRKMAGA